MDEAVSEPHAPAPTPAPTLAEAQLMQKAGACATTIQQTQHLLDNPPPHVRAWNERNVRDMQRVIQTAQARLERINTRLTKLRESASRRDAKRAEAHTKRAAEPTDADRALRKGRVALTALHELAVASATHNGRGIPTTLILPHAKALTQAMRALTMQALGSTPLLSDVTSLGRLCAGPDDPHDPANPEDFLTPPMPTTPGYEP